MENIKQMVSVAQVRAARALLDWSQEDLATTSGVSIPTIRRLEAARGELGGRSETISKIRAALEMAGVEFTNGDAPGVRLKRRENTAMNVWAKRLVLDHNLVEAIIDEFDRLWTKLGSPQGMFLVQSKPRWTEASQETDVFVCLNRRFLPLFEGFEEVEEREIPPLFVGALGHHQDLVELRERLGGKLD